jgi:hypothetical protein
MELCESGNATKNKGDMLATLIQIEQGVHGSSSGYKVL